MSKEKIGAYDFVAPSTLNFEHIFVPHAFKGEPPEKARYEADIEIDGDSPDLAMKAVAAAVARAEWPGRDLSELAFPWSLGDKLADQAKAKEKNREHSRGKLVLKARSKFAPALAVLHNGTKVNFLDERRPLAKEHFYNGVQVYVGVTFNAYKGVGQNPDGINAFLDVLVSTKKGTRLQSGGSSRLETFSRYAGSYSAEDPTAGQSAGGGLDSI